jgi:hypothetical protein
MRKVLHAAVAVLAMAAVLVVAGPARADTQICEPFGSTTIQNRYIVMNNRWGTSAEQCINVTDRGFAITSQQGTGNTSGAPVSYPAVYDGCHYAACSPNTRLPLQVSQLGSLTSTVAYRYVSGATYDAAYDIWLDPTPRTDGVNAMEIMIWFNRQGAIQPIGSPVGTVTIGGRTWQVWRGSNGQNNVISYLAPSAITSWNFSVLDFITDTRDRGAITNSWYLTSVQAGFEPWIGGAGLAVDDFSLTYGGGTSQPPPASCRVTYAADSWSNGFVATVTVANTGGAPVNGWTLGFTLPAGQTITSSWNATLSGASGALTARNISWNAAIPAGGSVAFGFQGTHGGAFTAPSAFTLNNGACAIT